MVLTRPASRVHLSDVIVQNACDDRCLRSKQIIKNILQKPFVMLNFRELPKPDYDLGLPNCDLRTDGVQFLDTYRHFGWVGALYGPSGNPEHPKDGNALFWTLIQSWANMWPFLPMLCMDYLPLQPCRRKFKKLISNFLSLNSSLKTINGSYEKNNNKKFHFNYRKIKCQNSSMPEADGLTEAVLGAATAATATQHPATRTATGLPTTQGLVRLVRGQTHGQPPASRLHRA